MPQTVRIEGGAVDSDVYTAEMVEGEVYVATTGNSDWAAGTPIVRAGTLFTTLGRRQIGGTSSTLGLKARRLRPGETVTVTGG